MSLLSVGATCGRLTLAPSESKIPQRQPAGIKTNPLYSRPFSHLPVVSLIELNNDMHGPSKVNKNYINLYGSACQHELLIASVKHGPTSYAIKQWEQL